NKDDEIIVNADKNYVVKNDSIVEYELLKSFNGKIITSHIILNDSVEVISVDGRKLYLILNQQKIFDLNSYTQIETEHKVKDFAYDGVRLFFSTFYDIYYIENPIAIAHDSMIHVSSVNIDFEDIRDIECSGNNFYVATSEGITIIPQELYLNKPNLSLESYIQFVQVDGEGVDFTSGIINIKGDSKLEIKFSSINYSSFMSKYFYMLEGMEDHWLKSDGTIVSYQNLKSGTYKFYLKSQINGDYFSLPKELIINVKPTLLERFYFWAFITIITFLLVGILLYLRKNKLSKKNNDEILLLNLESKALRSMMNPHFIFNSLGSIQNFILHNKPNEAGLYLSQFARLIRQNMNSLNSNFISIEDEVDKLRNYLDLECLRLNNSFDYNIDIDSRIEPDEIFIPTMMIQLFVENAIWHGISQLKTRGEVNVRFIMDGKKQLSVFIEDNGIGITKSMKSVNIDSHLNLGIDLTKKRLELLGKRYKVRTKLIISELYPGQSNPGARITFIFPTIFSNSWNS
ncbi:MAG: histidine kinase, partial [Bacteroidetes bacterium]|nr:histidine kinase [Bacteroidota bacterium]